MRKRLFGDLFSRDCDTRDTSGGQSVFQQSLLEWRHFILQQKISAAAVGLVIGFVAVQTGSLVPCIAFHAIYNSLTLLAAQLAERLEIGGDPAPIWGLLLRTDNKGFFQDWVMLACLCGSVGILWWFHRLPYARTLEEQLQESRDNQFAVRERSPLS